MLTRKGIFLFLLAGVAGPGMIVVTDLFMGLSTGAEFLRSLNITLILVTLLLLLLGGALMWMVDRRVATLAEGDPKRAFGAVSIGPALLIPWSMVHNGVFALILHTGGIGVEDPVGLMLLTVYAASVGLFFGVLLIVGTITDLESMLPVELALSGQASTSGLTTRFYMSITLTATAFVFGAFAVVLIPVFAGNSIGFAFGRASVVAIPFILLTVVVVQFLANMTTRPISRALPTIKAFTDGDLTGRLEVRGVDEVSLALHQFNRLIRSVAGSIGESNNSASSTGAFAGDLDNQAETQSHAVSSVQESVSRVVGQIHELGERVNSTVSATEEISRTLESLERLVENQTNAVEETASSAEELSAASSNVLEVSKTREAAAGELARSIRGSREGLENAMGRMQTMSGRANELKELNGVIAALAAKTNLLAMNAAIEAAHAGESGKGFAVVAAEIHNLAESASRNSKESSGFLKEMAEGIEETTDVMSGLQSSFSQVDKETNEVAGSMSEIVTAAREMSESADSIGTMMERLRDGNREIADGSRQITEGLGEINEASQASDEAARETRREIEQVEQSVRLLQQIAEEIVRISGNLKSTSTELSDKLGAYRLV
ncbi:MAG: methyl-accepting chemotaxis protein [Alkalispirochaetaceae bacterium]